MRNVSNISGGHEYESVFFKEELPVEFLIQNEDMKASEKFDILIVDEAQDLLTDYYLEIFDWILKGGINNGKWVMFGDFSNQAIYLNDPGNAKKRLDKKSFFAKLPPLRINCRNTKKIANHNSLLTGAKLPEFTGKTLAGKPINAKFPAKSKQSNTVIKIVKSLLEKGIKKSQITLLSPKKIKNTYLADSDYINEVKNQGLQLATIHSFKGLENVVIILFDFDEILTNEAKRLLYVGISRATQELILVLNQGLEANYNRIVAENYLEKN
jgi:superfamily I DNA/RNA helicase